MNNKVPFHTTLPSHVLRQIRELADEQKVSQNEVIAQAVEEYADNLERKREYECLQLIVKRLIREEVKPLIREEIRRVLKKQVVMCRKYDR